MIEKILKFFGQELPDIPICRDCGKPIRPSKPYTIWYHLGRGCGEFKDE